MASFNLHPIEPGWPRRWLVEAARLIFDSPLPTLLAAVCLLTTPLLAFLPSALLGQQHATMTLTILIVAPLYALVVLYFALWLGRSRTGMRPQHLRPLVMQELILAVAKGSLLALLLINAHAGAGGLERPPSAAEIVGGLVVIVSLNALPSMWLEPFVRHLALETGAPLWRFQTLLTLFSALRRVVPISAMLTLQLLPVIPFLLAVDVRLSAFRLAALPLLLIIQAAGWIAYREVFHGPKRPVRRAAFAFAREPG